MIASSRQLSIRPAKQPLAGARAPEKRPALGRIRNTRRSFGFLLGVMTVVAGCQSNPARVTANFILPATADPFDVEVHQTFYMADLILQPMPAYPDADRRLGTVIVCVELVVDERGDVAATRPLVQGGCPAVEEASESLLNAAVEAARNWKFMPAALCDPPPHAELGADCEAAGGTMRSVAVTLAFRFAFEASGKVGVRAL